MEKPIKFSITRHLNAVTEGSAAMQAAVVEAVRRFNAHDWGKLDPEDIEANNADLAARDGHVLAKYWTPEGDIYINLEFHDEAQEDYALLMFCNEY